MMPLMIKNDRSEENIMDKPKNDLSFEGAISELEQIVNQLEKGELPLDELVNVFQRGIELSHYCSKRLDEVERKITMLIEDEKNGLVEKPFMPEAANEL